MTAIRSALRCLSTNCEDLVSAEIRWEESQITKSFASKSVQPMQKWRVFCRSTGDNLYYIERLRCLDDDPVVLEQSYMPCKRVPEINEASLKSSRYDGKTTHDGIMKRDRMLTDSLPKIRDFRSFFRNRNNGDQFFGNSLTFGWWHSKITRLKIWNTRL